MACCYPKLLQPSQSAVKPTVTCGRWQLHVPAVCEQRAPAPISLCAHSPVAAPGTTTSKCLHVPPRAPLKSINHDALFFSSSPKSQPIHANGGDGGAKPLPGLSQFFFSLTLSKPPWHDQLARYHYRQQSFVTPYSSQIELGWERRLLDHSFFSHFCSIVAVPLLFSLSVGARYRYTPSSPLLTRIPIARRCLCTARSLCTVLVPVHLVNQNHTEWHATPAFSRRKSTGRE